MKNKHTNLPHINLDGYYQFVTFRTRDSIDNYLKKLHDLDDSNHIKQYKIDNYLDNSKRGAFLNDEIINDIKKYFLSYNKKLYQLIALAIMPNHIHILFKQIDELSNIIRILKGGSANLINKRLNKKGKVWSSDYYDKLIRDEKHFYIVYEYIKNNPIKADLIDYEDRFYGIYE